MEAFYQHDYKQAGLTTDLPDPGALKQLLAAGFKGSRKDFSKALALFGAIGVPLGSRILDFGANWGYGVWQLNNSGFAGVGYELSKPRADYSKNLGVEVFTDWSDIEQRAPYNVVFSSHVMEHTPNPAEALCRQLAVLAPGGCLIALFPNGSESFRRVDPKAFHRLWGRVHPVMLNEEFFRRVVPELPLFVGASSPDDFDSLKSWDRKGNLCGTLTNRETLIVIEKRSPDRETRGFRQQR